jgi:hypothetical protein
LLAKKHPLFDNRVRHLESGRTIDMIRVSLLFVMLALPSTGLVAGVDQAELKKDIEAISKQGRGTAAGRAAWDRVVQGGPALLPAILEAMDTPDTVAANWLRTAFDQIVDRAMAKAEKSFDVDKLLAYVADAKRAGRARRLALDLVERLRPGTSARLQANWLEDPEFRYDAVELKLQEARLLAKGKKTDQAIAQFRTALAASRDVAQGRGAAAGLLDLGVKVSVAEHLGFLMDWYLIGPFDATGMKGFKTSYPPENKIDLKSEYEGKSQKVGWRRYQVREPAPKVNAKHIALVNLREREALGDADDAVAFAYTVVAFPKTLVAEFRGAADDNFTVWVNGKREFGFEEYRNGVRLDRHRFRVKLRAGENTVLVKICQSPANAEPNWEFFLRIVDDTGKGIGFRNALPAR